MRHAARLSGSARGEQTVGGEVWRVGHAYHDTVIPDLIRYSDVGERIARSSSLNARGTIHPESSPG
jgi:hypothetical protein